MLPPHKKKLQKETVSVATAKEISLDAASVAVCSLPDSILSKEQATMVFLCVRLCLF